MYRSSLIPAVAVVVAILIVVRTGIGPHQTAPKRRLNDKKCSCYEDVTGDNDNLCCRRELFISHKHGAAAVRELASTYFTDIAISVVRFVSLDNDKGERPIWSEPGLLPCDETEYSDCRGVIVTRHWYDAIISGYLYHKDGQECYHEWQVRPKMPYQNDFEYLDKTIINNIDRSKSPGPPGNGRSLCDYLKEESEYDGMRVYMEWERKHHLEPMYEFHKEHQQMAKGKNNKCHTLFTCFHDLTSPGLYQEFTLNAEKWFYPGGQHDNLKVKPMEQRYEGQHSTNHSSFLRNELYDLVEIIDNELYSGQFIERSNEFACSSEIIRSEDRPNDEKGS